MTLWKNIKCVLLVLFFVHDMRQKLNKCVSCWVNRSRNPFLFLTKRIIFRVGGWNKIKKKFINFFFFCTFGKITVGGFVNQLIKKFWPKISNTLKLRTPKILAENNFLKHPKKSKTALFRKNEFLKLQTYGIFGGKPMSVYLFVSHLCSVYFYHTARER